MGFLWSLLNSFALFLWDIVQFFFWFIGLLLTITVASLAFYYAMGFTNFQMMATGYLLMPLAASESTVGHEVVGAAGHAQDTFNNLFVDKINDIIPDMEEAGKMWNRLTAFSRGVIKRCGEAFGVNMPDWEDYRRFADTANPTITRREFLARMIEELENETIASNTKDEWHTHARALEAKARILAIRIAKTLDPKGERISFSGIVHTICNVLRSAFRVVIDLFINFSEVTLALTDFIINILGVVFDTDFVSFAQVIVKFIINLILDILDPCKCFGGFPGNFPRSIFKCVCFHVYKSDGDVPLNFLNAFAGCFCPGFNIFGDVLTDIIEPCLDIPLMRYLLTVINQGVTIILQTVDGIVWLKNQIMNILSEIWGGIKKAFDFFKRARALECGEFWCTFDVTEEEYGYRMVVRRYSNYTVPPMQYGEDGMSAFIARSLLKDSEAQQSVLYDEEEIYVPNLAYFQREAERFSTQWSNMGIDEALSTFEAIQDYNEQSQLQYDVAVALNRKYMEVMMAAYNSSRAMPASSPMWSEEMVRALPAISCPLPIDVNRNMDGKAERIAEGINNWKEHIGKIKNYFLHGIVDRFHYATIRVALELHNVTVDPDLMGFAARRPERADDYLAIFTMLRGITRTLFETLSAPQDQMGRGPSAESVYQRLRDVPFEDAFSALSRTANDIRAYHGMDVQPLYDLEIKADIAMTSMLDPISLPRIARRYGNIPENIRTLEDSLNALERQLDNVDKARAAVESGDRDAALNILRYSILDDRAERFVDIMSGPPKFFNSKSGNVPRVIEIGVTIAAGGAITFSIGFVIGLAVIAGPIISVFLVFLAILAVPIMGVIFDLGMTSIQTLFDGGKPAGFDPVSSAIYLIGPLALDSFGTQPPSQQEITSTLNDMLDLLIDDLEHVLILFLRLLLVLAFPFVHPPKPSYDPVTGASTDSISGWVLDRIQCINEVPCTVSAGYFRADSLGECACFYDFGGRTLSRVGTTDEPCGANAGESGETVCYPDYRWGRYISPIEIIEGSATKCKDYGYDTGNTLWPDTLTVGGLWDLLVTWFTNFKVTSVYLMGLLAAGKAIPLVGLAAYPLQSACPCFRFAVSPVFKLTAYTQILSIFWPTVAQWYYNVCYANRNVILVKHFFNFMRPFTEPREVTFDEVYCSGMYSGPWLVVMGTSYTLLPIVVIALILYAPLFVWAFWRIVLWPVNTLIWIVMLFYWTAVTSKMLGKGSDVPIASFYSATWSRPFIDENTPQSLVNIIIPE